MPAHLWRNLTRDKSSNLVAIAVLALGIASVTAMFSVVNAVILRPLPYAEPNQLYELRAASSTRDSGIAAGDFETLRAAAPAIIAATLITPGAVTLTGPEGAENVFVERLAGDALHVYRVSPQLGQLPRDASEQRIVISHRLWKKRYAGAADIIGRSIDVNGEPATIAAVMPANFSIGRRADLWTAWQFTHQERSAHGPATSAFILRLAANANPDAIAPVLNTQARQHEPAKYSNLQLRLQPISERVIGKSGQILWPLFGAVGLVLLVACINAGSLLVVRGLARRREIAVRAALGAARWQLIRPVLADATAIAIAAAITGAALASAIVSGLKSLLATSLSLPLPRLDQTIVDVEALAIALAAAVISIFVASLVPALSAMRVDPAAAFNDNSRAASASRATIRFGIAATILQTTFSVVLLTGAGLLLRSLVHVIEQDPGYDREGVLTARVPMPFDARQRYGNQAQYEHYRNVLQTARAIPGVQSAAVTTVLPLGRVAASVDFIPEGQTARKDEYVQAYGITPDYFRVMGIALKAGRAFDEHDTAGAAPVVVINEVTARRYWPGENPIGKRVQGKIPMTVIGVVGSVRRGSMREAPKEEIYRPLPQFLFGLHGSTLVLRTTAGISPESLINTVQSTLTKQYPTFPVSEIRPMTSWIEESVATSRLYTVLLGGFSVQALLIASAGLFGLLSHIAAIRRREMGVRIAIGARPSQIALLLLRQGLAIVSIGTAAGAFGGVLLADLLRTQLYGIEPTDPTTLCAVAGAFAIIAVLAMLAPALRAGRTDPAHILRAD